MTGLQLLLIFVVACFFALNPVSSVAADPTPQVDIRSEDGKVLIAADQIRAYEWATHTLTLAPKVRYELAAQLLQGRLASGVPFAVVVGGKIVYKGTFTSAVVSQSVSENPAGLDRF